MAKQKISDKLQAKFDKPQFQIGAAVFFSWLGTKQYGYVKKTKQSGWGTQYTVESPSGVKYPCGIQIQGQKTHYNTGYILYEDTVTIGAEELERRIQSEPKTNSIRPVSINSGGSDIESTVRDTSSGTDDGKDSVKAKPTRKKRSSKQDVVAPSNGGNDIVDTKKRTATSNKELETAIEKQRNFLSGFVKKD
jgi:hypothetical protein